MTRYMLSILRVLRVLRRRRMRVVLSGSLLPGTLKWWCGWWTRRGIRIARSRLWRWRMLRIHSRSHILLVCTISRLGDGCSMGMYVIKCRRR
jgi:hypothetical protein